jgi:hypothetical protein
MDKKANIMPMTLKYESSPRLPYLDSEDIANVHTDIEIMIPEEPDHHIRVHRAILAATCHVLKSCLLEIAHLDCMPTLIFPERSKSEVLEALDVLYGRKLKKVPLHHIHMQLTFVV